MAEKNGKSQKGNPLVKVLPIYMGPELKEVLEQERLAQCLPMSKLVIKILAEHFGKPDLAKVPMVKRKKRMQHA